MIRKPKPVEVLLVEDNPADVLLTKEAFRERAADVNIRVVEDGEDALACLRREGEFADCVMPDFVLLDLNLPRKDGREVLIEVKNDPHLKQIPIVILTSSEAREDVLACYRSHANGYVTKPSNLDGFNRVFQAIDDFWCRAAQLPTR